MITQDEKSNSDFYKSKCVKKESKRKRMKIHHSFTIGRQKEQGTYLKFILQTAMKAVVIVFVKERIVVGTWCVVSKLLAV